MAEKYAPPSGPPPSYLRSNSRTSGAGTPAPPARDLASNNPFRGTPLGTPQDERPSSSTRPASFAHAPPPGPPPGWSGGDVEMSDAKPPPGQNQDPKIKKEEFTPPEGPPPSQSEPPPYDPWHGPDESLRPPPTFTAAHPKADKSPTANADYDDAARAHDWCRQNRLWPSIDHNPHLVERIQAGDLRLTVPPNTADVTVYQPAMGRTYLRTSSSLHDTIMLSDVPIYASHHQAPLATGRPHTVYFELRVLALGDRYNRASAVEAGIAIGFVAPPYPAWRLPGWHRGSLGVHGDDGRRFVDNSYGGQEFVAAFKKDDVVGIGITYALPVHGDRIGMRAEVFFTRNGKKEGGWDLHEERDRDVQEGDVTGLEGEHDLLAAVGIFGAVEVETHFREEEWMFKPTTTP